MNTSPTYARPEIASTPSVTGSSSTPKAAKSSTTSTPRQPWKREEEEALLAGLTDLKGPHWSMILSLYGRGGSVSEVLKDRNQIQLKDKARNLKLWYLKMGNPVPECLTGVTGELRKRGGARVRALLGLDGKETSPAAPASGAAGKKRRSESSTGGVRGGDAGVVGNQQVHMQGTAQIDPALMG